MNINFGFSGSKKEMEDLANFAMSLGWTMQQDKFLYQCSSMYFTNDKGYTLKRHHFWGCHLSDDSPVIGTYLEAVNELIEYGYIDDQYEQLDLEGWADIKVYKDRVIISNVFTKPFKKEDIEKMYFKLKQLE